MSAHRHGASIAAGVPKTPSGSIPPITPWCSTTNSDRDDERHPVLVQGDQPDHHEEVEVPLGGAAGSGGRRSRTPSAAPSSSTRTAGWGPTSTTRPDRRCSRPGSSRARHGRSPTRRYRPNTKTPDRLEGRDEHVARCRRTHTRCVSWRPFGSARSAAGAPTTSVPHRSGERERGRDLIGVHVMSSAQRCGG